MASTEESYGCHSQVSIINIVHHATGREKEMLEKRVATEQLRDVSSQKSNVRFAWAPQQKNLC